MKQNFIFNINGIIFVMFYIHVNNDKNCEYNKYIKYCLFDNLYKVFFVILDTTTIAK